MKKNKDNSASSVTQNSKLKTQNRSCVSGFTLLEILIVLTLVVLMLGLSTIYFAGFLPAVKFNATGREISALIRHARSLARMNMQTQRLIIDLDERTYGMAGQAAKEIPPNVLIRIDDPASGEILHGKYRLVFHPSGGMEGGAILLSGGRKKMRIDMDPITGATKTVVLSVGF